MKAMGLRPFLILFMLLHISVAIAQDDEQDPCAAPSEKKIVKLLDDAGRAKDPLVRHQKLKAALEENNECAECLYRLGLSAFEITSANGGDQRPAIDYLEKLDRLCPQYHANVPYHLGVMYYSAGKFAQAAKAFKEFQDFPIDDKAKLPRDHEKKLKDVEEVMPELEFHAEFHKNTASLDPVLIENVSTSAEEYLPMLSPDNALLFFTRVSKVKLKGDPITSDVEELMESRSTGLHSFDVGRALPEPFNVGDNYGGVTISLNNKEMFVTICAPPDASGYRNCDIFSTRYEMRSAANGKQVWEWSGLEDLGEAINTPDGWESQPSLSADGKMLFFAAQRDEHGMDIYVSERGENGEWQKARKLDQVNTLGDEKAPFIHSDSRTLYFAARPSLEDPSIGHRTAGGYDIFFSRMNEDGSWSKPKNIGHPVNSDQDEHGLIVSAGGRTAYFASNRFRGAGGLDIYRFEMPQEARPDDILVVKGEVRDEEGNIVRDARIEVKYMDTRKVDMIEVDESDGKYATVVKLKDAGDVVLTVKKKDHVFDSRSFSTADTSLSGVAEADMTIQKIEVGRNYQVNDIKYATNSADITPASEFILDELIGFLNENPKVKIRVDGHTDNVGDQNDNMALSLARAGNVVEYLIQRGIARTRLSAKGFGPTVPLASNATPEGRAQNRRTEFVIVGK